MYGLKSISTITRQTSVGISGRQAGLAIRAGQPGMNRDRKQTKGPQCRAAKEREQALTEGPQEPKYDPATRTASWKTTEEAFENYKQLLKLKTSDWPVYLKQLARMNQYHSESSTGSVNQENAGNFIDLVTESEPEEEEARSGPS
ncbi:hypothetical protein Dimus_023232 [Dionaea muscipula]